MSYRARGRAGGGVRRHVPRQSARPLGGLLGALGHSWDALGALLGAVWSLLAHFFDTCRLPWPLGHPLGRFPVDFWHLPDAPTPKNHAPVYTGAGFLKNHNFALGLLLGSLCASLGTLLGSSWCPLGRSWVLLGCSWTLLGPSWALLGRSWALLGCSWASLGRSWPLLRRSWNDMQKSMKNRLPRARACACPCG